MQVFIATALLASSAIGLGKTSTTLKELGLLKGDPRGLFSGN